MTKKLLQSLLVVGLSASSLLISNSASALTFTTYTNRSAWQAALGGSTNGENFNSFTSDSPFGTTTLSVGSLSFNATNVNSFTDPLIDVSFYLLGATGIDDSPMLNFKSFDNGESVAVNLATAVSGFGFDYENYDSQGDALSVLVGSDLVTSLPASSGAKGFIGFIATGGTFNSVNFSSTSYNSATFNAIDNLEWGLAAPQSVPESSPVAGLLLIGAFGMGIFNKSKV